MGLLLLDRNRNRLRSGDVVDMGINWAAEAFFHTLKMLRDELPVGSTSVVETPQATEFPINPDVLQLTVDMSVAGYFPNPPRLYAVDPVPAFCAAINGQQTSFGHSPIPLTPLTKAMIAAFALGSVTPERRINSLASGSIALRSERLVP